MIETINYQVLGWILIRRAGLAKLDMAWHLLEYRLRLGIHSLRLYQKKFLMEILVTQYLQVIYNIKL